MFCKNCGKQLDENILFCSSCGTKVESDTENAFEPAVEVSRNEAPVMTEAPVAQEVNEGDYIAEDTVTDAPPVKKKSSKSIIALCIIGVVVVLGVLGFLFRNAIFFALTPEKYTGNLIANTLETIVEEAEKIEKNILGFALTEDDELTAGISVEVKEDYEDGINATLDYKVANNPKNAELLLNADVSYKEAGEDIAANVQGFWNDEKIGIAVSDTKLNGEDILPEAVSDKYFVVPSKKFGDSFMDSIFEDMINRELVKSYSDQIDLGGLDLSYTNVTKMLKGEEFKPLIKELKKEIVRFMEDCDISDRRSVKFRFDGDKVNAKKITVTVEGEDLIDFAINALEIIEADDYIQESFNDDALDMIDSAISELKSARAEDIDLEFDVDFVEYDGRIVEIEIDVDGEAIAIRSTDKAHILNGIEIEAGEDNTVGYTANWVNEDKEVVIEGSVTQYGSKSGTAKLELDYAKEKFEASLEIPGVDRYSVKGKCSKKNGFSITIDHKMQESGYVTVNSMEYDDWFDENYRNVPEKNYAYYAENELYDDLYDVYWDDEYGYWRDFDSYADWYDTMGADYDTNYKSYDEWLDEIYNEDYVKDEYNYSTGESEYRDYDVDIKFSYTLKKGVDVKIKDRKHINIFEYTQEDLEKLAESFIMGASAEDAAAEIEY